jgi:hypothetical protein
MPQLSGWQIMLGVIATGIGVGFYYEPVHVIPLMIWALQQTCRQESPSAHDP